MKKRRRLIITIDGPSGAGKSTVAKAVAQRLTYIYFDTGALYRSVAFYLIKEGLSPDDENLLLTLCKRISICFKNMDGNIKVFVNRNDVTEQIRTEEIGLLASKISASQVVRSALLPVQRKAGGKGGIVIEGRDIGTVVFPDADVKFFLDANIGERIKRRYNELVAKGIDANLNEVEKDLIIRDRQDIERKAAPLKIPKDSIVIDSSDMMIVDVVEYMMTFIKYKLYS